MKIIFDFDDVLFDNISFKKKVFSYFEKYGLSNEVCESLYKKHRAHFSLRKLYDEVSVYTGKTFPQGEFEIFHKYTFSNFGTYVNSSLVTIIEKVGKENCFILTAGDAQFQNEKIIESGLITHIDKEHIIIVKDDKKESLLSLCTLHRDEIFIFVDDKEKHTQGAIDLHLSNLHVVLYDSNGFTTLINIIDTQTASGF